MARLPRLALAGHVHLVQLQGHNNQPVFADGPDRSDFLAMLREAAQALNLAVHAYCLLEHELRLLLTPREAADMGRLMQALGRRYVSHYNRRHQRTGTLWNGRFRSAVLQAEPWLLKTTLFVERLPLQLRLVADAADWPWSSAQHHLGQERSTLITEHTAYWQLGNTPFERELAHANLLKEEVPGASADTIERALRSAHVLGDVAFCTEIAAQLGRPAVARKRGRPAKVVGIKADEGVR